MQKTEEGPDVVMAIESKPTAAGQSLLGGGSRTMGPSSGYQAEPRKIFYGPRTRALLLRKALFKRRGRRQAPE